MVFVFWENLSKSGGRFDNNVPMKQERIYMVRIGEAKSLLSFNIDAIAIGVKRYPCTLDIKTFLWYHIHE